MPKFNHISNIPAKVFFDILKTKNYQLLKPKPKETGLEQIFISIYDSFFEMSDNQEAKDYLKITMEIHVLEHKINVLKLALHHYYYSYPTYVEALGKEEAEKIRLKFIESVKIGYGIVIDANKPFIDEVQRVLQREIGILNNELSFATISIDEFNKANTNQKETTYFDKVLNISMALPPNLQIKPNMMLDEFCEWQKTANAYQQQLKSNNK